VLNRDELRKETLKTVNQLLGGEPIVKVYFSSYVLQ
jgi:flagellar basal body-associated protein FliL